MQGIGLCRLHSHRSSWLYAILPGWLVSKAPIVDFRNIDELREDWPAHHKENLADVKANGPIGSTTEAVGPRDAEDQARMHDFRETELDLNVSSGAGTNPDPIAQAQSLLAEGLVAFDKGNYSDAARFMQNMDKAVASSKIESSFPDVSCYLARANEFAGRSDEVYKDLDRGGQLVRCYSFRGDVDDHRGNWTQAQQDYAAAVRLAPSLPIGYQSWGEALARHLDYDGAIQKFTQAHQLGPHWCDPLEHWGEALAAKGDFKQAVEKYAEATKYAPNWAALYIHWGQSLDKLGKHSDPEQQYRKIQSQDLSDADQEILNAALADR